MNFKKIILSLSLLAFSAQPAFGLAWPSVSLPSVELPEFNLPSFPYAEQMERGMVIVEEFTKPIFAAACLPAHLILKAPAMGAAVVSAAKSVAPALNQIATGVSHMLTSFEKSPAQGAMLAGCAVSSLLIYALYQEATRPSNYRQVRAAKARWAYLSQCAIGAVIAATPFVFWQAYNK